MVLQYFHWYCVVLGTFKQSAAHGLTEVDLTRAPFQISVLAVSIISKLLSDNSIDWSKMDTNRNQMRGSGDGRPKRVGTEP